MGNGNSGLHGEALLAASHFDKDEICVLQKTWQDLADRTNGKGIDKETFLQYFPLNGLLGERLFAQFDTKGKNCIDFDEFITGLALAGRGTEDEKIHFMFNMFNVSHDQKISKQELSTLLNQVPKEALHHHPQMSQNNSNSRLHSLAADSDSDHNSESDQEKGDKVEKEVHHDEFEQVDTYTNHDLVERAFDECDILHEGRLNYEEFKMWVQRNPEVIEHLQSILPFCGSKNTQKHHDKRETLPLMKRMSSKMTRTLSLSSNFADGVEPAPTPRRQSSIVSLIMNRGATASMDGSVAGSYIGSHPGSSSHPPSTPATPRSHTPECDNVKPEFGSADDAARNLLLQALEAANSDSLKQSIASLLESIGGLAVSTELTTGNIAEHHRGRTQSAEMRAVVGCEGNLWKKGNTLHFWSKRYYLLSGNCMYYYSSKEDVRPKGVIFLTGSLVDNLKEDDMAMKGYFGFELLHQDLCTGEHHRHEKRILYCKSQEARERWVTSLQHAAQVVPIEDDYVIGKELGRGRFSVVCECVHKITGKHCACKIIDKTTIETEEKALLRTEIGVMKLVNHPNIISLEGIYESRTHIYLVMEMLKGGELFERIVGRPRFSETDAAKLIRPLLESVAYLHDLGIVHRDLKPENILCGENLEDLKIADFGLSKMILPKEKMDAACGTLSYVAPEVLTLQGYGKEADLWSVGVIMFLLLCGKLPFDGEDHNEIIRSTIQGDLKVNPAVWNKLSEESRALMTALLNKSPKDRISARDALMHPFLLANPCTHRRMSTAEHNYSYKPNLTRQDSAESSSCSEDGDASSYSYASSMH